MQADDRRSQGGPVEPAPGWFEQTLAGPGVMRITEPAVHPFFRANAYFVHGRDLDLQIDFGVGVCDLSRVLPKTGRPLLAVATHAHVDHVGSFHTFERRAGHAAEASTFAAMEDAGTLASWFMGQDGALATVPPGFSLPDFALQPAPLTETLAEGSIIDTGDRRFRVLHLPGHSPGSIGLLDEHGGTFFTGDAIYDDDLVDDVPGSDVSAYRDTMRRLLDVDFAVAHGGHGQDFGRQRLRRIAQTYLDRIGG